PCLVTCPNRHVKSSRLSSRRRVVCGGSARGPQLSPPAAREQRAARREPAVEGDGVECILHHRAHPDEPHAMGHEGAHVAHAGIGNPDEWNATLREFLRTSALCCVVLLAPLLLPGCATTTRSEAARRTKQIVEECRAQRLAGQLSGHVA